MDCEQAGRVGRDGEVGEGGAGGPPNNVADRIEAAPVATAVETLRRDRALLADVASRVRADQRHCIDPLGVTPDAYGLSGQSGQRPSVEVRRGARGHVDRKSVVAGTRVD